jgi:methylated-DNA-protein-cysteine methyltransferase-like protein
VTANPGPRAAILRVVRRIPAGRVATYGEVAAHADLPGRARLVGWALRGCDDDVPWQRVLNAKGEISLGPGSGDLQRDLLESEGVEFDARGRVDLARFGWRSGKRRRSR